MLLMSQLGSALSASFGYAPGISGFPGNQCTWTGTAGSTSVSLNAVAVNCATNLTLDRASCPDNRALLRDIHLVTGALTATVSGNTATGTEVDTYSVLVSGTQTVVGTLIVNSNISMTCEACGPSANYPNLIGTWTGYMDRDVITNGVRSINQCLATWSIHTQNGGDFAGSFTAAPIPGDTNGPCAQPAAFSGTLSAPLPPTSDRVNISALPAETMPGCTLQGQSLLIGVVTPSRLLLHQENYFPCGPASTVQNISFNLARSGS